MSEDELNQDSAGESEQSDEQPVSSEQSQESEATEQSPEQSVEGTDQSADQSDEKPAHERGQPAEQSEEQGAESNEPSEQVDEQAADSDQPATSASADNTLAFAGGAAAPGGGPADDAVAADSGSGPKRNLKVIATFTQDGKKFMGEILIRVFEDPGRELFPRSGQVWQSTTLSKGNVIRTPLFPGVTTTNVVVFAQARMWIDSKPEGTFCISKHRTQLRAPGSQQRHAAGDHRYADSTHQRNRHRTGRERRTAQGHSVPRWALDSRHAGCEAPRQPTICGDRDVSQRRHVLAGALTG